MENIAKYSCVLNVIILASLLAAAAFIRAPGLGKWCFNEDEYYYSQPVAFILEKGVPLYPGGGYYTRGFGLQYLTVIPALLFKNWEFATRFVPLLFGVMTVPLLFILANRFLGTFPAILCSTMLLLSSWHIEFSRFARFYAPFQFFFLLFIYSLQEGYGTGRKGYRILAFVVGLVSVSIDAYSIFLPLVLLFMIVMLDKVDRKTALSITIQAFALIAINLVYSHFNFDTFGVVDPLPPGFVFETTSPYLKRSPIIFPSFGLLRGISGSASAILGYLLLLGGAGYLFRKGVRHCGNYWDGIALTISLSFPLLHQYTLLVFLLVILLINKRSVWPIFKENAPLWGIFWIVTAAYWVAIAASTGNLDKILFYAAGFPPIKRTIFLPFQTDVPLLGGFLLAVISLSTIHHVIREQAWPRRYLISVVLLLILTMPVFYTFQRTTRYVFFFFPLVLLLAYAVTVSLIAWIEESYQLRMKRYVSAAILLVPMVCYAATEDFHWRHILYASSAQMNFRMGKYDRYFKHWYQRADFEGPTQYVNREYSEGDVVIADHIVMTRYLDKPYTYYVYYKQPEMYPYHARKGGTEEKWTGRPLISRPEELAALVPANPNRSLWLITSLVKDRVGSSFMGTYHNVQTITDQFHLNATLEFKGLDGRVGVWKITRSPETPLRNAGQTRSNS
jgi:hypothetical protein